ncbi:MAG: hypothetical protein GX591_14615 [Planctomycetes bacterium]|nr:hypothetical protein [Planctomycetota bacterium]
MRKMRTMGLVLVLAALATQAEMVVVDDGFDGYQIGTAHRQGDDGTGTETPRWAVQQNTNQFGDPGGVTIEPLAEDPANLAVRLQNRDRGVVSTIYACMSLGPLTIYGEGTIYVRFKADAPNDTLMGTNDLWSHWDYAGYDTGDATSKLFQQMAFNYNQMGALVRLSGGEDFRACDGSPANPSPTGVNGYKNVNMGQEVNVWQELWVQIDQANDRARYYLCPDGGQPAAVPNPNGGTWWAMRNEARNNDAVANLKFFMGGVPATLGETNVLIESIAIDTEGMTLDRYAGWEPIPAMPPALRADLDGDGDVDLDDFVILKNAFGTGDDGDCDGDGDTDLDDFVILKNEFGS